MNNLHPNAHPQLGATFYPGGVDDFYMPEVISPAPQRIMPEVPENMQDNLAHLEQHVQRNTPASHHNTVQGERQYNGGRNYSGQTYESAPSFQPIERPTFSRFPVLVNRPPNVPPTPEETEASLEAARLPVLRSKDTLEKLDWAQDALAYVEQVIQNERRTSKASSAAVNLSGVQQMLKQDAIQVTLFLADQGHPRALVLKGIWLEFGKFDYAMAKKQAWECYNIAVANADVLHHHDPAKKWGGRALYRMGMQFENSKDIGKALKYYQMGVDSGDSAACYRLGMMVLLGEHGQTYDLRRGLELIFSSAQNADANAPHGAYVLGMLQARELPQVEIPDGFLARDIGGARRNIERAAFLGSAKAQLRMGSAYELCELDCEFNPALSLHYNHLAARQGVPEAEMAISKWFLAGQEGVFETDDEMAFVYAQRAAQDRLSTAQFAMGYFHEVGIFVPVNLQVANDWYKEAEANGNKDAAARIEGLSRSNTLSRKYHETIAVSRIKDSRFRSPSEPEFRIDMPDPARMSSPSIGLDRRVQQRSQSVAPYPAHNDFGFPRPTHPESSPNSGINPLLRPSSAATIGGTQFRTGSKIQGRPNSTSGRVMSGPPQGSHGREALPHKGSGPTAVDIGFLAPLETRAAHGKRPFRKPESQTKETPPPNASSNASSKAQSHSRQRTPNTPLSPAVSNSPRFPQTESTLQEPMVPNRVPSSVKPAAETRPPGKGPKTFEEMGVPQVKRENECVVM